MDKWGKFGEISGEEFDQSIGALENKIVFLEEYSPPRLVLNHIIKNITVGLQNGFANLILQTRITLHHLYKILVNTAFRVGFRRIRQLGCKILAYHAI